ncbi:unnamed protein product, partial [marine sediment metagenome]
MMMIILKIVKVKLLIEGIEEEGLSLARLYILGLSRDYIRRLVGAKGEFRP